MPHRPLDPSRCPTGLSTAEFPFDIGALLADLVGVFSGRPSAEVGDQWRGAAEQDEGGAERQGADDFGWHDRYSAYGALERAGAVVADRDSVGLLVAFADQRGEVLEVFG